MKECCEPVKEKRPNQLAKWGKRGLYILIALIVLIAAWNQFKTVIIK